MGLALRAMPAQSLGNIGGHKLIQTHSFSFGLMLKSRMNAAWQSLHEFSGCVSDAWTWTRTTARNVRIHPAIKRTASICNGFFWCIAVGHTTRKMTPSRLFVTIAQHCKSAVVGVSVRAKRLLWQSGHTRQCVCPQHTRAKTVTPLALPNPQLPLP